MKKQFKSPYEELISCIKYLDEKRGIENKMIAEKLNVSSATISRLKIGASPERTERYLKLLKEQFRAELVPFIEDLPDATNDTIMKEIREIKEMGKKILNILQKDM